MYLGRFWHVMATKKLLFLVKHTHTQLNIPSSCFLASFCRVIPQKLCMCVCKMQKCMFDAIYIYSHRKKSPGVFAHENNKNRAKLHLPSRVKCNHAGFSCFTRWTTFSFFFLECFAFLQGFQFLLTHEKKFSQRQNALRHVSSSFCLEIVKGKCKCIFNTTYYVPFQCVPKYGAFPLNMISVANWTFLPVLELISTQTSSKKRNKLND